MITLFNKKDMVSFGNYLLSEKRKARYEAIESPIPVEERLKHVNHADVERWKDDQKKGKFECERSFSNVDIIEMKNNGVNL